MSLYDEIDAALKQHPLKPVDPLGENETTVSLYAQHRGIQTQTAGKQLRRLVELGLMEREKRRLPTSIQPQWVYWLKK